MVGDYGVLNGQEIDWSGNDWRNRYESAPWLGVPLAGLIFARALFPTAVFASRILIALQVVLRIDPTWKVRGDRRNFGVMTRDLKWIN